MTLQEARSYAVKHIRSVGFANEGSLQGLWPTHRFEEYGVIERGSINIDDPGASDAWFEVDEERSRRIVEESANSAEIWDMARNFCAVNLLRDRPLSRPLREFAVSVLIQECPRPRATESYNNAKRDVIFSAIIFEVWVLFDLSEAKACEAVREGALDAGVHAPASLIDFWRMSDVKRRGLPDRTDELHENTEAYAADRLKTFLKLNPCETTG